MNEVNEQEQGAHWLCLPDLGEGLRQAVVVEWPVAEGERVAEGDPLVRVETDKAIVEIPAPVSGTVAAIASPVGSTVPVGARLAQIVPG